MSSAVKRELEGFIAGRRTAQEVAIAAAVAYYRDARSELRHALRPVVDVIDRASPGIIELGSVAGGSGFDVRLAERPFPRAYEDALRQAAVTALDALPAGAEPASEAGPRPEGLLRRMIGALQRWLSGAA
jgi:hypothetical protein